ncbi:MAG: hypothetical protein LRY63_10415 [Nitrincola sp.]|nr:hypothetical protein [Nitrincola sp.]
MNTTSPFIFLFKQQGVGLIEVLITLLIFTTGSLALTQLQLRSLQLAYESHQLSRKVLLQGEAVERLWQERCYLVSLSELEKKNYLLQHFPSLFSHDPEDPQSPIQVWQQHQPVTVDC